MLFLLFFDLQLNPDQGWSTNRGQQRRRAYAKLVGAAVLVDGLPFSLFRTTIRLARAFAYLITTIYNLFDSFHLDLNLYLSI